MWTPSHGSGVERGVGPGQHADGFIYLGVPIGGKAWCSAKIAEEMISVAPNLSCLHKLRDSGHLHTAKQVKNLIVRYCAATRPTFWLRGPPPDETRQGAEAHDDLVEQAIVLLASAHAVRPDRLRRAVRQASQPIRQGGLGATSALSVRDAAYCASYAECWLEMKRLWPELAAIDLEHSANPPSDIASSPPSETPATG